jgi:hypothetical protein
MQKNLLTAITGAVSAYMELEQLSFIQNRQPNIWWQLGQHRQISNRINIRKSKLIPGPGVWRNRV